MTDIMWNNDSPVSELDIDVPVWIDQDITPSTIAAILQGGCDSGAYMPAVTYHTANDIMAEHGDDVLEFIEDTLGDIPGLPATISWKAIAVQFLSQAVELWCVSVEDEIIDTLKEDEEDE